MNDLLLGFYGDDFTGSTDAMDALSRTGVETVLFLSPPSRAELERVDDARAIGIAGTSRTLPPTEMADELEPAFAALAGTSTPLVHYKICSTFDSSPEMGNIGTAIDAGADAFGGSTVPVLPGAPPLGRYVAFGNMFAEAGDDVYRLDRHPTMRDHPVTPMSESDLLRHLSEQTDCEMDLLDVRQLRERPDEAHDETAPETSVLFFDSLTDDDLATVGRLLWERYAATDGPRDPGFVVGSSGVEYALANHWEDAGLVAGDPDFEPLDGVERVVVMSGSASPVTERQIENALDGAFEGVRIDTEKLIRPDEARRERERVITAASETLEGGNSVVMYTALGPDDLAIERTREAAERIDDAPADLGAHIGAVQGSILRTVAAELDLPRLCIAGGDTCGHVAPRLGIDALTVRYPLAPGSPLCEVAEGEGGVSGRQVALKGGQLGGPDYFSKLVRGE